MLWQVESLNARLASSYNLKKDSFKVGDAIEIKGWPAKDGSNKLGGHQLALPGGEIFVLSRAPDQSPASPNWQACKPHNTSAIACGLIIWLLLRVLGCPDHFKSVKPATKLLSGNHESDKNRDKF